MSRVWALRVVFISLGLLVCLFAFRDAIIASLWEYRASSLEPQSPSYQWAVTIFEDGWGVAILAAALLYGLYRLFVTRL